MRLRKVLTLRSYEVLTGGIAQRADAAITEGAGAWDRTRCLARWARCVRDPQGTLETVTA